MTKVYLTHRSFVNDNLKLSSSGRNKTLGVIGYGDIGQSCARMARVFGMHIAALRRRTDLSDSERDSGLKVIRAHSAPGNHSDPASVLRHHLKISRHMVIYVMRSCGGHAQQARQASDGIAPSRASVILRHAIKEEMQERST